MKVFIVFAALAIVFSTATEARIHGTEFKDERNVGHEGPLCPLDDPLFSPGVSTLNESLHLPPIYEIFEGSSRGDLHVTGLSGLWYEVNILIITLTVNFHLKLQSINLTTAYEAQGWVDATPLSQETIPSGNFTGRGELKFSATDVEIQGNATIFINIGYPKVIFRTFNPNIVSFSNVSLDLGHEFIMNGSPIDWDEWSEGFVANWNREFEENREAVVEKIRRAMNVIVGEYTLEEFVDIIGGEGQICEN